MGEKIRAELQESEEKVEPAEVDHGEDAVVPEGETISLPNDEMKRLVEESSIPKEIKAVEVLEELEDEKRVITSSGFRRHASLVAAEGEGLLIGRQAHVMPTKKEALRRLR